MTSRPYPEGGREPPPEEPITPDGLTFLLEYTTRLAGSLDYFATLRTIVQHAVTRLAGCAVIRVLEEGGVRWLVALSREWQPPVASLGDEGEGVLVPDDLSRVAEFARTGQTILLPTVDERLLTRLIGDDEQRLTSVQEFAPLTCLVVPFTLPDMTPGALTLIAAAAGNPFGDRERRLAAEVTRHGALALANARRFREALGEVDRSMAALRLYVRLPPHGRR
jgi:GAF domain-containing protein